ncbi:MAG: 7-carboxy-7-deazaguanine synthase QueE [Armatimonadetes bacterium]|nr:7-carboxy-7-deazaguanine synthase QueE [Armatimonadota bacterium]
MSNKLRITETFTSIQGEGIWAGTPSHFIRVSGCNLRCRWCDTPYASWSPEGPIVDLSELIEGAVTSGVAHVVVTGGEPMLFPPVVDLCAALKEAGKTVTIETAGTVFQELACDLMSISPKLSNSTPDGEWRPRHELTRHDLEPLRRLVAAYDVQLKFVIEPESGEHDIKEIEQILAELPHVPANRILLMPEGTDTETLRHRMPLVTELAEQKGWGTSPRLHIEMFGNKRGT